MRCYVTATSQSQNSSPWNGDVWIPQWVNGSRKGAQSVKRCALSFGGRKGGSLLDFLVPWHTIDSDHYIVMLTKLKARTSRAGPEKKTTFLLPHNTRPHTNVKTMEYIANLGILFLHTLVHPSYSLDLMSSDFHRTGPMQDGLCGQHFPSSKAIIAALKQVVISAGIDFYECSMQALVHPRWKCIANNGDCLKKQRFEAENLLYQTVSLCFLHLL